MSKFVPYHRPSIQEAKKLVTGISDPMKRYEEITRYVEKGFVYDYVRAITIPKRNGLPDVDRCWKTRMGICLDISAMTVGMLRAVGLKSYLCIGMADRQCHAWVETIVSGKTRRYDHRGKAKTYKTERRY